MKILQELLLLEAEAPIELKAVIDAFPKHHEKALAKLWGGKRLTWHGMRFFEDGELGEAYSKAEEAAEAYINDGYNAEVQMETQADGVEFDEDSHDGLVSLNFDAEFSDINGGSRQECYLGYDPTHDKLYIGFDAWISEDEFNNAFDKAFEEATGLDYDSDDEAHHKVFEELWEDWKNEGHGFWGLVFEIDKDFNAEEALPPMQGGFYKGAYKLFKSHHPKVVDLRLD